MFISHNATYRKCRFNTKIGYVGPGLIIEGARIILTLLITFRIVLWRV